MRATYRVERAPFPMVHTVPFHYANPVSGRVPPVLLP